MSATDRAPDDSEAAPEAPLAPRAEPFQPPPRPEEPTVPLTGLALILAITGLLFFMALPSRPLDAAELAAQRAELELRLALVELRGAIGRYRLEHAAWPGRDPDAESPQEPGAASESWLALQLGLFTDARGRTALQRTPAHPHGPYLTHGVPLNPWNRSARVHVLGDGERMPAEPLGDAGWIYAPFTGEIRANVPGYLPDTGERIFDL